MNRPEFEKAKAVALTFCAALRPGEDDIVDDGFELLASRGYSVSLEVPEHAFQISAEAWTYTLSLCTLVGGVFAASVRDVATKRLSDLLTRATMPANPLDSA